MLTRSAANAAVGRASAMRRMRRRSATATATSRLYCSTNGCTSFLVIEDSGRIAQCEICGYTRRLH